MDELIKKVEQWAHDRNLVFGSNSKAQCLKLMSEVGEMADNINKGNDVIDDIGDCFVVLIILANQIGVTPKTCLEFAYKEIKDRKGIMVNGTFIKESDPSYQKSCERIGK